MANIAPEFLVVGGDVTRDGDIHEYEYQMVKDDFESLPFPAFVIPGNMDVGNKHAPHQGVRGDRNDVALNVKSDRLALWSKYFGALNWSFVSHNVRVTGFFDAVAGSGLREEKQMWDFLEHLATLPRVRHHVAVMHYALFIDRIDEPTFDPAKSDQDYLNWYFGVDREPRLRILECFRKSGVQIVLQGHIHCRRPVEVVDGIRFYKTPAGGGWGQWANRWPDGDVTLGFHRLDVSDAGIDVTFVPLEKVSQPRGYGPGGHPLPSKRDYSIAQEPGIY